PVRVRVSARSARPMVRPVRGSASRGRPMVRPVRGSARSARVPQMAAGARQAPTVVAPPLRPTPINEQRPQGRDQECVMSEETTQASPEDLTRRLEEEGEIAADYLEELLDIVDLDG